VVWKICYYGENERNFYVRNVGIVTTVYEEWAIQKWGGEEKGSDVTQMFDLTADSHLCRMLHELTGDCDNLEIQKNKLIIWEAIFAHTNRWKIFDEVREICRKKGQKQALKYLYDKFSIIALGDKLEGK